MTPLVAAINKESNPISNDFNPTTNSSVNLISSTNNDFNSEITKDILRINAVSNYNSDLILIDCFISNCKIQTLIDSGASYNFISLDVFENLKHDDFECIEMEPHNQSVQVANNQLVNTVGKVRLQVFINEEHFEVDCIILSELNFEFILGMKFLKENKVLIDAAEKSLTFQKSKHTDTCNVTISEHTEIPAFSEVLVPIKLSETVTNPIVIKTCNDNPAYGLGITSCIIDADQKFLPVANFTSTSIRLDTNTCLAHYSDSINIDDIHELDYINVLISKEMNTHNKRLQNALNQAKKTQIKINVINHAIQTASSQDDEIQIDCNEKCLNEKQKEAILELLKKYPDIFAATSPGVTKLVEHSIDVGNNKPINQMPYKTSPENRRLIELHVQKMLADKVIQVSRSPWASPVILVGKKDGTVRVCNDYRKLNQLTVRDVYPLPRIDDALSALLNKSWFSSLDLTSGYYQIPMRTEDRIKTAFVTDSGLYEYLVMPFGLTNACATFQRFMDTVLAGLKWKCVLVYIDDILVFSQTFEEHMKDLEEVFKRMKEANLKLKPSKCHLLQRKLEYRPKVRSGN